MKQENSVPKHPPEVFYKKVFLKILQNSQENNCARVYSNQVQVWDLPPY